MKETIEMMGRMTLALEIIESCSEFSSLIPEVRTNLVYAKKQPNDSEDVLAIDGRITIVNGMPKAAGRIKWGASSHMARLITEICKRDATLRAGINFANNSKIVELLRDYSKKKNWIFSVIDRSLEPERVKIKEGDSMPWKVARAIRAADNRIPKLFYEKGAVGKEPVSVLLGENPIQVAKDICKIAKLYKRRF